MEGLPTGHCQEAHEARVQHHSWLAGACDAGMPVCCARASISVASASKLARSAGFSSKVPSVSQHACLAASEVTRGHAEPVTQNRSGPQLQSDADPPKPTKTPFPT